MLLLTLALACGPSSSPPPSDTAPTPSPPTASSSTSEDSGSPPVSEREALERAGFLVQEGSFLFSTMEGCCEDGANCWGNNPSTPYGTPAVPPAPGESADPPDLMEAFGPLGDGGLSRSFHLRADEALVLVGRLGPRARYFGYRSYLGRREGLGYAVTGSLGPSLNHQVVAAARGVSPDEVWDAPLAIVTSADAGVEARVHQALEDAGWDPATLHDDRIPPSVARLGYGPEADDFFALMRIAVYDDPEAGRAWQMDPGFVLYRVSDPGTPATRPHPVDPLPRRGAGSDEEAWRAGLDALQTAVQEAYADHAFEQAMVLPYWRETIDCITSGVTCAGDIRDRFVALSQPFRLAAEGESLVILGVNHARTGKASYSSFAVQTIEGQRGIVAVDSSQMPGSIEGLLPDHPMRDDLYAWVAARDCASHTIVPCVEVPLDCPGVGVDGTMKVTVRAYLEPTTGAAPLPEELVADRVFKLTPRSGFR